MVLPALVILIWFRYVPMYGLQIVFKRYNLLRGIMASPWADPPTMYLSELFNAPRFFIALRNTLIINFYRLIFQFPIPIIFALMINECRNVAYKRIVQTVSYLPHFLSWVIVYNLFFNLLSFDSGIVNRIITFFGGEKQLFFSNPKLFRGVLVGADIWQSAGWGTIVILAAITAVDPQLHEAAYIDGADKLKRIWHVTMPCIRPTIIVLLILRTGSALADNVEMVLQFYNPMVYDVGDVLGTYIYRVGLGSMRFSFAAAAGFFSSIVNCILLFATDRIAKRMGEHGLW